MRPGPLATFRLSKRHHNESEDDEPVDEQAEETKRGGMPVRSGDTNGQPEADDGEREREKMWNDQTDRSPGCSVEQPVGDPA